MYVQRISENKVTKEVDEVKKSFLRNTVGLKKDGMMRIIRNFCPSLASYTEFEQLLEKTFTLVFTVKKMNLDGHQAQISLYQDNGVPFSLSATVSEDGSWVFPNIPLKTIMSANMAVIISVIESRKSKVISHTQTLLNTSD